MGSKATCGIVGLALACLVLVACGEPSATSAPSLTAQGADTTLGSVSPATTERPSEAEPAPTSSVEPALPVVPPPWHGVNLFTGPTPEPGSELFWTLLVDADPDLVPAGEPQRTLYFVRLDEAGERLLVEVAANLGGCTMLHSAQATVDRDEVTVEVLTGPYAEASCIQPGPVGWGTIVEVPGGVHGRVIVRPECADDPDEYCVVEQRGDDLPLARSWQYGCAPRGFLGAQVHDHVLNRIELCDAESLHSDYAGMLDDALDALTNPNP